MTAIIERQRARLYTQKAKKLQNVFIYKKPDTFQKVRQFPLRFYKEKAQYLTDDHPDATHFSCFFHHLRIPQLILLRRSPPPPPLAS